MTFIEIMRERGFIRDITDEPTMAALGAEDVRAYIGFDLTAPSLHVGSLIQLMVARWLLKTNNSATILLGSATTRIGDPSGKDTQRPVLSRDTIEQNHARIKAVIKRIVGPNVNFVDNDEWFNGKTPSFMNFLSEYGPHFTINRMMTFDSVKRRLDRQQPLTFLEFTYMLLQAVDFRELHDLHNINMQIGGSDQWGNIINGVELIRRMDGETVHAFTTPLLTDSAGNKIGKTSGKPLWLDAEMTSPFELFQFFRNIDDELVTRFFFLFTEMSSGAIGFWLSKGINVAKKMLAHMVVMMVHGVDEADAVLKQAEAMFENNDLSSFPRAQATVGSKVVDLIAHQFSKSKSEARRLIAGGAVVINDIKLVEDISLEEGEIVLKVGKKNIILVNVG